MSTARLFAYNTGTTISGTSQYNDIAVQTSSGSSVDFSIIGIKWYMGPDEDLGWIISSSYLSARPRFSRSKLKNDASYIDLLFRKYQITFPTAQSGATWLNSNGYWTSYISGATSTPKTYLVDFGILNAGYTTPSPTGGTYWNNFASGNTVSGYSYTTSGITLSNLVDANSGTSSTLSIVLTSNDWVSSFSGGANYQLTGTSMSGYIYPASATRDAFAVLSPLTGTTSITGCDNSKTYNIGILSSKYPDSLTTFVVQGVSKTINPSGTGFPGNTTLLIWNNVVPVSGIITMSAYQPTATEHVWLNVMEIKQN